jgi:hypothetical protein
MAEYFAHLPGYLIIQESFFFGADIDQAFL